MVVVGIQQLDFRFLCVIPFWSNDFLWVLLVFRIVLVLYVADTVPHLRAVDLPWQMQYFGVYYGNYHKLCNWRQPDI